MVKLLSSERWYYSENYRGTLGEKKYLQVYGIRPKNQLSDFKREVVDSLVFSRSETCIAISALIGVSLQEKKMLSRLLHLSLSTTHN